MNRAAIDDKHKHKKEKQWQRSKSGYPSYCEGEEATMQKERKTMFQIHLLARNTLSSCQ